MFALDSVDDLVFPQRGSATARALDSMVRRRTFERLKQLDPATLASPRARDAAARVASAFALRLPGDPHEIAAALAEPGIGAPIRLGFADEEPLVLGLERLLAALEGEARVGSSHDVEGRLRLVEDHALARSLAIPCSPPREPLVLALRAALDRLRTLSPALRADADRFALVCLVSGAPPTSLPPAAIGLALVPDVADPEAQLDALAASIVVGKLHALVDGRAHDPQLLEALRPLAAERLVDRLRARPSRPMPPLRAAADDPLAGVLAELGR